MERLCTLRRSSLLSFAIAIPPHLAQDFGLTRGQWVVLRCQRSGLAQRPVRIRFELEPEPDRDRSQCTTR